MKTQKDKVSSAPSLAQTILEDTQMKHIEETYEPGAAFEPIVPDSDDEQNESQALAHDYDVANLNLSTRKQSKHVQSTEREGVDFWANES